MPKGVREGEEPTAAGPNALGITFRVPVRMKDDIEELVEYGKYSSPGEFLRTLVRERSELIRNTPDFRAWLKRKEDDEKKAAEAAKQAKIE